MYSVLLIGALIAASALIAYIGDVAGRRLGRRRVTLFGLRPKYTAILISVFTGMFITALTLTVVAAISKEARLALFSVVTLTRRQAELGNQVRFLTSTKKNLEGHLTSLTGQTRVLRKDIRGLHRDLGIRTRELAAKRKQLAQKSIELEYKITDLKKTKSRLTGLREEIRNKIEEIEIKRRERDRLSHEVTRVKASHQEAIDRYVDALTKLEKTKQKYQVAWEDLKQKQQELDQATGDLDNAKQKLEQTRWQFNRVKEQLQSSNQQLTSGERLVATMVKEINRLENSKQALEAEVTDLRKSKESLEGELKQMEELSAYIVSVLTGDVIFEAREALASEVLSPFLPITTIRHELQQMLERASTLALQRGAKKKEGDRAVIVGTKRVLSTQGEKLIVLSEEQILELVVNQITQSPSSVVVDLVALRNVVRGEQVVADFQLTRSRQVFRKGEILASRSIQGNRPPARLFEQLIGLLEDVNRISSSRGLRRGAGGKFGDVSYDDLFRVLRQLQSSGLLHEVRAIAVKDTWTAGPLEIELQVIR